MGYFADETRLSRSDLERGPLPDNQSADVAVIGAGIAGLTTAYVLAGLGRRVILLDDGPLGGGETANTSAHLSCALDDRYHVLERQRGIEIAALAAQSHSAAIDAIERISRDEGIDCGFERVSGYLFLPPGEDDAVLDKELHSARAAGLSGVRRLETVPGLSFDLGRCLEFPNQGQFNPIEYLAGLARALERRGGRIYTGTHVRDVSTTKGIVIHASSGHRVRADSVVLATNASIVGDFTFDTSEAAYRTYALAAEIAPGSIPRALYWDTSDTPGDLDAPYHYVRVDPAPIANLDNGRPAADVLIVGGEDHRTGQADDGRRRWDRLEEWARKRFGIGNVRRRWSGQIEETADGLALIGRHPHADAEVYVVTGDSGMGLTHGTIAGLLLGDLITGKPNRWATAYAPDRGPIRGAMRFAGENLNTMVQYADYLRLGEVSSVDEIPAGRGAVIRQGLKLLAVYRDADGTLHEHSAVCPHRGGIVHWNSAEHSWDCPCHGSRFDACGHVLNGPANTDLAPAEVEDLHEARK